MTHIFDKVKLLFRKDKELYSKLYKILGFYPKHIDFYRTAFAHRSQMYRNRKGKRTNNERLEFLGDAVLEAVVSDIVFRHFERASEGFLTNTRSKLVSRAALNELGNELGIDKLLKSATQQTSHNSNLVGNAFEALVGAIYLDQGYEACIKFVSKRIVGRLVNVDDVAQKEVNFKSKLLEYCQKNRIHIEFSLKNMDTTNGNAPVFRTLAKIEGVPVGEGKGYSKKESEQLASKDALLHLRKNTRLKEAIFHAKEERTAMEASEFAAVPIVDEIEEELKKEKNERTQRQREKRQEKRQQQPKSQEAAPKHKAEKPAKEAEEPVTAKPRIAEEAAPAEEAGSETSEIAIDLEAIETAVIEVDNKAESLETAMPRRRGRKKKSEAKGEKKADETAKNEKPADNEKQADNEPAETVAESSEPIQAETPKPRRARKPRKKAAEPETQDNAETIAEEANNATEGKKKPSGKRGRKPRARKEESEQSKADAAAPEAE